MQKNINKIITKQITAFGGVIENKGKILMALRTEEENPAAHMKWELPGGKCEYGETPQQALKRELMEETGIEVEVGDLIPFVQTSYWDYPFGKQQTLCFYLRCKLIKQHPVKKDHHIADIKWFTQDEAAGLDSLPGTKEVLKLIRS